MPTYEYECGSCGGTSEFFQTIREAPKKKCPRCGKRRLRRLIGSGAGLIFRGSGFYITDYRSSDYQAKAKAEGDGGQKASQAPAGKPGGDSAAGGDSGKKKTARSEGGKATESK
jgi:putative FmdB family regulatory protein